MQVRAVYLHVTEHGVAHTRNAYAHILGWVPSFSDICGLVAMLRTRAMYVAQSSHVRPCMAPYVSRIVVWSDADVMLRCV